MNQSVLNIRMQAKLSSSDHPGAVEVLSKDIYLDDVNPGAEPKARRDDQISSNQLVLSWVCVVYCELEPGGKTSPDEEHMKLFGYKWDSMSDTLYPGVAEINLK